MKILYISHTHPRSEAMLKNAGGMQRVSFQLVKALEKRADIDLKTETIHAGSGGNVSRQTTLFLLKLLVTLPQIARKFSPDVILFSSMVTASLAFFLRKRLQAPLVAINHGRDVTLATPAYQKFIPHVFKALDGAISVSEATRQQCIQRGMKPEKGVALPNGIDIDSFVYPDKNASRSALEEDFNIPLADKKMLLTVGRFVERKGHAWFIENVLPKISDDVIYVTIGKGPQLQKVKKVVSSSKLKDRIYILGRQPDKVLKQAYAAGDLFIMPNIPVEGDMEGFGVVMLEANLAGMPAVATDIEGIKDVIKNGVNGYKVSALNAQYFANKIDQTLHGELNVLSKTAQTYVKDTFNWTKVADKYVKYLQSVGKPNPGKLT